MPNFTELPERHYVDKAKRLSLGGKDSDTYFDGETLEAMLTAIQGIQTDVTKLKNVTPDYAIHVSCNLSNLYNFLADGQSFSESANDIYSAILTEKAQVLFLDIPQVNVLDTDFESLAGQVFPLIRTSCREEGSGTQRRRYATFSLQILNNAEKVLNLNLTVAAVRNGTSYTVSGAGTASVATSGGTKYEHHVTVGDKIHIVIVNDSAIKFTKDTLAAWLRTNNYTNDLMTGSKCYPSDVCINLVKGGDHIISRYYYRNLIVSKSGTITFQSDLFRIDGGFNFSISDGAIVITNIIQPVTVPTPNYQDLSSTVYDIVIEV